METCGENEHPTLALVHTKFKDFHVMNKYFDIGGKWYSKLSIGRFSL